jgi:hypothetical protein
LKTQPQINFHRKHRAPKCAQTCLNLLNPAAAEHFGKSNPSANLTHIPAPQSLRTRAHHPPIDGKTKPPAISTGLVAESHLILERG